MDQDVPLPVLLRKCRLLASRLNSAELKDWVIHELNSYPADVVLPEYRVLNTMSRGTFVNIVRQGTNMPIPSMCIDEEIREDMATIKMRESVATIASIVQDSEGSTIQLAWPPDLVALHARKIYERMTCVSAHRITSKAAFVGILDTVRNKVLDFAIDLVERFPDVTGDEPAEAPPIREVQQVFVTNIMGSHNTVSAGGGHAATTNLQTIVQGNLGSLKTALRVNGVSHLDLGDLEEAIKSDEGRAGKAVETWKDRMLKKADEGAWKIGTSAAGSLLSKALAAFFGLA